MKDTILLYRGDNSKESLEEKEIAAKYFQVHSHRSHIPPNTNVLVRCSFFPCSPTLYFDELDIDLKHNNSHLLQSVQEHKYIANFDYYEDIKEFTFQSWSESKFPYEFTEKGPFIVKGRTNSKKQNWGKLMFAKDKTTAIRIAAELSQDSTIGPQGLIYRKYLPLKTFEIDFNETRYTNEWRLFYLDDKLLSYGYYWTNSEKPELAYITPEAFELADKVAKILSEHVRFFVIDIAEKESGGWIVVEINDGQASGLSFNDPEVLYRNLKEVFNNANSVSL